MLTSFAWQRNVRAEFISFCSQRYTPARTCLRLPNITYFSLASWSMFLDPVAGLCATRSMPAACPLPATKAVIAGPELVAEDEQTACVAATDEDEPGLALRLLPAWRPLDVTLVLPVPLTAVACALFVADAEDGAVDSLVDEAVDPLDFE